MMNKNVNNSGVTEFRAEYYKNPITVGEIPNESVSSSLLGFLPTDSVIPEYLQAYVEDYAKYDGIYKSKYSSLIINSEYITATAHYLPASAVDYVHPPRLLTKDTDYTYWKSDQTPYIKAIIATNDYKYRKLWSTIDIEYDIMNNLNIERTESVTETFGERTNLFEDVHGKQEESTNTNIGGNTVTTDHGKQTENTTTTVGGNKTTTEHGAQTSTATTNPVTTTTTNPQLKQTTLNKSTTYDSETAYLHDSSEVTTDSNIVTVGTSEQTDSATTNAFTDTMTVGDKEDSGNVTKDAFTDTVTNGDRTDTTNVSRETFTNSNTEEFGGYTNTRESKSTEKGDASLRTFASMLMDERKIAYINLLDIIFKDVFNVICDYTIY